MFQRRRSVPFPPPTSLTVGAQRMLTYSDLIRPKCRVSFYLNQRGFVRFGRVGWSTLLQNKSFEFLHSGSKASDKTDGRGEGVGGVWKNRVFRCNWQQVLRHYISVCSSKNNLMLLQTSSVRRHSGGPRLDDIKKTGKGRREKEEGRE